MGIRGFACQLVQVVGFGLSSFDIYSLGNVFVGCLICLNCYVVDISCLLLLNLKLLLCKINTIDVDPLFMESFAFLYWKVTANN